MALFLFLGVVYASYIGFTSHYDVRVISMTRFKLHRRDGTFLKRTRDFFNRNRLDIATGTLVATAVTLRTASQFVSASLLEGDALNDAAPGQFHAPFHPPFSTVSDSPARFPPRLDFASRSTPPTAHIIAAEAPPISSFGSLLLSPHPSLPPLVTSPSSGHAGLASLYVGLLSRRRYHAALVPWD